MLKTTKGVGYIQCNTIATTKCVGTKQRTKYNTNQEKTELLKGKYEGKEAEIGGRREYKKNTTRNAKK